MTTVGRMSGGIVDKQAEIVVRNYLAAMEARDLEKAKTFLSPGFTMVFPGGHEFRTPEELIVWAKSRYQQVAKEYEAFESVAVVAAEGETAENIDGETIVYCRGTLFGQWLDGSSFAGIRFIDRFTVSGDQIISQVVWNDLAENVLSERMPS